MNPKNTLLITGATGFLGSHLCAYLLENTPYDLCLLKRSFSGTSRLKKVLVSPRVCTYDIDTRPPEDLPWHTFRAVVHCATEYGRKQTPCHQILASNLIFPVHLLELAIAHGVETFINTDSYFNKENFSYSHLLHYALSKKSLELWLKHFAGKIKIINLMLEHIFGENDNADKFAEQMIRQIAVQKVPRVALSAGTQKRDFIYVEDACKIYAAALAYAAQNTFAFEQFDVGSGQACSIRQFVSLIQKISASPTELDFGALPARKDEIVCSQADLTALRKLLPDFAPTPLETALRKIIAYYQGENP